MSQQRLSGTHGKKHSNNGNKKLTIMHEGERVSISDTFYVLSITILPMSSLCENSRKLGRWKGESEKRKEEKGDRRKGKKRKKKGKNEKKANRRKGRKEEEKSVKGEKEGNNKEGKEMEERGRKKKESREEEIK